MQIDWRAAEPRTGWRGAWDRLMGPATTAGEAWLELLGGGALWLLAAVTSLLSSAAAGWSWAQIGVVLLISFDLAGGIVVNATSSAKRWYHRPGQGLRQHLGFIALHGLHLALVAWLFRGGDWRYAGATYAYLLLASSLIASTRLYLQRPLGVTLYAGSLVLSNMIFSATPGLGWFLPFFYLKLLIAHMIKEAPFAPSDS